MNVWAMSLFPALLSGVDVLVRACLCTAALWGCVFVQTCNSTPFVPVSLCVHTWSQRYRHRELDLVHVCAWWVFFLLFSILELVNQSHVAIMRSFGLLTCSDYVELSVTVCDIWCVWSWSHGAWWKSSRSSSLIKSPDWKQQTDMLHFRLVSRS